MIEFAGLPCLDPVALADELAAQGVPISWWYGRANRYTNPIGLEPGRGLLLMAYKDLKTLSSSQEYNLVLDSGHGRVRLQRMTLLRASCITPGFPDHDDRASYAVEIVDRRYRARGTSVARYNMPVRATTNNVPADFWADSLNAGARYTWPELFTALWDQATTLGDAPDWGTATDAIAGPIAIQPQAVPAVVALQTLLDVHHIAVAYNPVTDVFWAVDKSADEPGMDALLKKFQPQRIHKELPVPGWRRLEPVEIQVHFPTLSDQQGRMAWEYHRITVPVDAGQVTPQGTHQVTIHDPLLARRNAQGNLVNEDDLDTRADEVAANYLARMRRDPPLLEVFHGFRYDVLLQPNGWFDGVSWYDVGRGPCTEVVRHAF